MAEDLSFLLLVDARVPYEHLINVILDLVPSAVRVKHRNLETPGNWIEVKENEDFDPERVDDPEEGFLFYRYQVEVTPKPGRLGVSNQVLFARELLMGLRLRRFKAEVCSTLEDQIEAESI